MGEVEEKKKKGRNGKFAFLLIYFLTAWKFFKRYMSIDISVYVIYNYICKIHWKPAHQKPSNLRTNSHNYWEFCQYSFRCDLLPVIVLAFPLWVLFIQPAWMPILHVLRFRCLAFLKCSRSVGEWVDFSYMYLLCSYLAFSNWQNGILSFYKFISSWFGLKIHS